MMWCFLRKKQYLHKHITSAVKVFSQLVVMMLLGQYGLHLHHPRCYEHVVRLHVPEKREMKCFNWETGHFDLTKSKMKVIRSPLTLSASELFAEGSCLSGLGCSADSSYPSVLLQQGPYWWEMCRGTRWCLPSVWWQEPRGRSKHSSMGQASRSDQIRFKKQKQTPTFLQTSNSDL